MCGVMPHEQAVERLIPAISNAASGLRFQSVDMAIISHMADKGG